MTQVGKELEVVFNYGPFKIEADILDVIRVDDKLCIVIETERALYIFNTAEINITKLTVLKGYNFRMVTSHSTGIAEELEAFASGVDFIDTPSTKTFLTIHRSNANGTETVGCELDLLEVMCGIERADFVRKTTKNKYVNPVKCSYTNNNTRARSLKPSLLGTINDIFKDKDYGNYRKRIGYVPTGGGG